MSEEHDHADEMTYHHHPSSQLQPQSQVLVEILVSARQPAHFVTIIHEVFAAPGWPTCTGYIMDIQTHGVT